MAKMKGYDTKKKEMARRTQPFKAMAKETKPQRSTRFMNLNPETTDSRADG